MGNLIKNPINIEFIRSFITMTDPERPVLNKINITPELVDHLDGRCFIDLDISECLEGVQFRKTNDGITAEYCGTDGCGVAYCHDGSDRGERVYMIDKYGEHIIDNTYNGCTVFEIVANPKMNIEIPVAVYEYIKHFVKQQIKIMDANQEYISSVRELILKNLEK